MTWTASTISITEPKSIFTASTNLGGTMQRRRSGAITITGSSSVFTTSHVDQYINVTNGFGRARITKGWN